MEQSIADKRAAARGHNNESRLAGNEEEAAGDMSDEEMVVDIDQLRNDPAMRTAKLYANAQSSEQAMQLWQAYMRLTHDLSSMLAKQLRLIPHIASEFRNGKIWLCRTKPARHEYQVTIALNQPEVGRLSVVSFGKSVSTLHPFDHPFNANAEPRNGAANSECSTSPSARSVDNTKVKDSFVSTSAASSAAASSVATPPTTASTLLATAAGAASTRTPPGATHTRPPAARSPLATAGTLPRPRAAEPQANRSTQQGVKGHNHQHVCQFYCPRDDPARQRETQPRRKLGFGYGRERSQL